MLRLLCNDSLIVFVLWTSSHWVLILQLQWELPNKFGQSFVWLFHASLTALEIQLKSKDWAGLKQRNNFPLYRTGWCVFFQNVDSFSFWPICFSDALRWTCGFWRVCHIFCSRTAQNFHWNINVKPEASTELQPHSDSYIRLSAFSAISAKTETLKTLSGSTLVGEISHTTGKVWDWILVVSGRTSGVKQRNSAQKQLKVKIRK